MCGRFALTLPDDALARLFDARLANDLPQGPRYNICPTHQVAVLVSRGGARHLGPMRWGLIPTGYMHPTNGPILFNARSETLAIKPAFAQAARLRRCLVPANAFYEWTKDTSGARLPWAIARKDRALMALAGVWQVWERNGVRHVTCAIVTCPANDSLRPLHDRMPVLVSKPDWPLWLGEAGHGAALVMRPAPSETLEFWRVGPAVNSNRTDHPPLLDPLP